MASSWLRAPASHVIMSLESASTAVKSKCRRRPAARPALLRAEPGAAGGAFSRREYRRRIGPARQGRVPEVSGCDTGVAVGLSCTLRLARDRGMISGEEWERLDKLRNHAGAVTWRLYDSLMKPHSSTRHPTPDRTARTAYLANVLQLSTLPSDKPRRNHSTRWADEP